MLLNNFFEIKEKVATKSGEKVIVSSRIAINKAHPIFKGHFPGQPVVPGVCMIQMVKEILESHLSIKLLLTSAANIKFLSVINPEINSELNIEISYTSPSHIYNVDARLYRGEVTFFKIQGNLSTSLS